MKQGVISVIILSYNTRDLTKRCLEAVHRSWGVELEVIVVDNGSTDGSVEMIEEQFDSVKLIKNKDNLGFAKGNNLGMSMANGEKILLLNSDAFIFEDTVAIMSSQMDTLQVDLLGCKLLNKDGTLQPSWGYFPNLRRVAQMMVFLDNLPYIRDMIDSIHVRSKKRYLETRPVDWVTGACVMLRKNVYTDTKGIDEKYFMYGEEMEWMYRIKNKGFKVAYSPKCECVHLEGASSKDRTIAITGEMKGWVYWFSKHNPKWQLKPLGVIICTGCLIRQIVKRDKAKAYKQAMDEVVSAVFGQ